ncbi:MAG: PDZ domain-containing protein [Acidobacteriia bacterium]|nr:PDZ domain-containing protein [Terriglobia bacterium]
MTFIRSFFAFMVVGCVIGCACLTAAQESQEGRLLRFPDIYKDKIAFMYGGDLWLASSSGGTARRITSHPGRELFPKFSPDGKWLAFTGQYDGNFNVYVMPSDGGQPKQLTFYQGSAHPLSDRMGVLNQVIGWTPDGKSIVFLSRSDASNGWIKRPFMVNIDGGLARPMPMDEGGLLSFSADGTKIAYNRIFRNFRQWKRYTGGLAQDITIYDIKNNVVDAVIPHTDYTDTFPMWRGNTIYFTSDRGSAHRFNLYSYDTGSKQVEQLTKFDEFDLMWPSLGPDAIIFENGGYLYTFDLQTRHAKKLTIYVNGERDHSMKHWVNASRHITDFDISPDGKRAVFAARGEVFTVPAKDGSIRNLTHSPGVREQKVTWSPNGQWIAYISDRTGEDEIYITAQDGLSAEQQITSGHKGFMFQPAWSPDSSKIAWADKDLKLWYVDITEKKPVEVDRAKFAEITNYSWSPDSKWLAYDKNLDSGYSVVYLYGLADRKITAVTSTLTNSYAAVFDPDKRYLYFLSDRDYNEVLGNIDFEFANPKTTRVYVVTLTADEPSPFPALSDEVKVKSEEPAAAAPVPQSNKKNPKPGKKEEKPAPEEKAAETATKEPPKVFKIDLDGIQNRIVALAVPPAIIRGLDASKDAIYYSTSPIQGLSGPLPGENKAIHGYDLKEHKDKLLLDGADRFALSHDGTKLLYRVEGEGGQGGQAGIIDAKLPETPHGAGEAAPAGKLPDAPHKAGEGALKLDGMTVEVDPPQEWKEIFNEVWRQERDYFFEASMNGVDWQRTKDQYAQLLPHVADRYSLTYIMGEMIGELSNSHTYVGGGDMPDLHPVNVGLLGADYEVDAASGMYRFKKIFSGENWNAQVRSPLTEPGVNVKEGEYLVAINGRALRAPETPDELLVNTANEVVTLTVNAKPTAEGARKVVVKPIGDEYSLRELNMVETNRKKVDVASGGRIGYVYLPDMGDAGLNEFVKQYFPQIRKQGIIFDVRYNGGGFVDQLIFERLRRVLAAMQPARNFESGTIPQNVFYGYMACVTNHYAASDGDFFSYFFKQYKLGPLIGERTWGGVRGIRGNIPLMDGGYITRPEFSLSSLDGKWLIENRGVQPDVVVDNPPDLVLKGQDPQLEKAIDMLMQEIKANPKKLPARPPDLPTYPEGPGL